MVQKIGLISVLIFFVSTFIYLVSMFSASDLFSGQLMIFFSIILPIIGFMLAFKARGVLKKVGIIGNLAVLFVAGFIPIVASLFWNTP